MVAFAGDGRTLAVAGMNRAIELWDPETSRRRPELTGHPDAIFALASSAPRNLLASGGEVGMVAVWAAGATRPCWLVRGHNRPVDALAFSPSGRLLASTSADPGIRLWEVVTGREVCSLPLDASRFRRVLAFAPDGKGLLVAEWGDVCVQRWELSSGQVSGEWVLTRLEVTPAELVLKVAEQAGLRVTAHWSGGLVQDVTRWAVFDSWDRNMVDIPVPGRVHGQAPGHTAITVRYQGRAAGVGVTVRPGEAKPFPELPSRNAIDKQLIAAWKKAGLHPGAPVEDRLFLRRAYLTVLGTLPSPEEVKRFLASKDPQRRPKLIDELLGRPEYAEFWAIQWARLLGIYQHRPGPEARQPFHDWMRKALAEDWPADRIVRELLLARGEVRTNAAVAFTLAHATPPKLAEATAQAFVGVNLICAQCHHHPHETWDRDAYHATAACFGSIRYDVKALSVAVLPDSKFKHPTTGKPVQPAPPGRPAFEPREGDPRQALADWLTADKRQPLARNLVNRYWAHVFGRGLIEPLDGLYESNPAAHPALLNTLTQDFVKGGYRLKDLLRTLCRSGAFELTPLDKPGEMAFGGDRYFAPRRGGHLPPDTHRRAIAQACGVPAGVPLAELGNPIYWPPGAFAPVHRAIHPAGTCPRHAGPPTNLLLLPGEWVSRLIAHPKGRVSRLLAANATDEQAMTELFQAVLVRPPTADEAQRVREHLRTVGTDRTTRRRALEEILWALLNTREAVMSP